MPIYIEGDMLAEESLRLAGLTLITAHAMLDFQGHLVMERGILRQVRTRWPGIEGPFGDAVCVYTIDEESISAYNVLYYLETPAYNLIISDRWPRKRLGLFQNRLRFTDASNLEIIRDSVSRLVEFCQEQPQVRVHLNYPGADDLPRYEILPLLEPLPNTVWIWELPQDGSLDPLPF